MIEFLTENWKFIVIIGSIVIDVFLVLIFKKRPQIVDNSFLFQLTSWIQEAETKFRIGQDKMKYVLEKAATYLGDKFSEKDVKQMVEYILTLPEKKEK